MEDQKIAIYADNKTVYIAPSLKAATAWRANDWLEECRHDYFYNMEGITEAQEKALQEAAANGYIFLYYPNFKTA